MTSVVSPQAVVKPAVSGSRRASALAGRLQEGARLLADLASSLSEAEWQSRLPKDGRKVGVVVHHVASVYPVEIGLAQTLAAGERVRGVTMDAIHAMNAEHARTHGEVTRAETLDLLRRNSEAAAAAIRTLDDEALDRAAPASLYDEAPITCQFMLEDHPVRHSYHHFAVIRAALKR